ncbi:hypothetical protein B566_EDAN007627 [Ephemera danica]|nr:hypothetical protein B566_EDAN007627 [Ephemera danica]
MGRQAASARRQLLQKLLPACKSRPTASAIRALLFTAVLATACLALGLQVGFLALPLPPATSNMVLSSAEVTLPTVSAGLAIRTIVAYSLEAQLKQAPLPPCPSPGPKLLRHPPLKSNDIWQTPSSNVFLLSAYYDTRVHLDGWSLPSVRIIAMLYGNTNTSLYCQVWFGMSEEPIITRALQTEIWAPQWDASSDEHTYRPFLLSCPVSHVIGRQSPTAVSVVEDNPCVSATTLLPLATPTLTQGTRNSVAVCVKGLDFEEDRSVRLVEWLEINRLLGANKLVVYLYSVHPNMSRVLNYYEELGIVQVIRLTLPGHQPNNPSQRTSFLHTIPSGHEPSADEPLSAAVFTAALGGL